MFLAVKSPDQDRNTSYGQTYPVPGGLSGYDKETVPVHQRRNDLIFFVKFPLGHVDPGSGIPEFFAIFPVSEPCVIRVFVGDGAVTDLFGTAVADIRSPVKS